MIYIVKEVYRNMGWQGYLWTSETAGIIVRDQKRATAFDDSIDTYDDICAKYLASDSIHEVEKIKLYDIDELVDL